MSSDRAVLLLDRLRECDLLEAAQLDELAQLPEALDPDPRALGRVLLQRRLLSRFQINLVVQGRARELRVGPYLLLDKIGEGGMGQVFKARHAHMNRVVALKVIRKEKLASSAAVKRFYQEIELAAKLSHPNIVIAHDAGPAGASHYFAMELVEGTDLAQQVQSGGPVPVALACEYARQAALGLQHAHEKGLIHRDVKPHNLLVCRPGGEPVVKVLDLGLARLQSQAETGLTQLGQVLGTPDYLAPEQAVDSRKADVRSDVYGLGCTLHFLIAGRPPFTGQTMAEVLLKHQLEAAPELAPLGAAPGLRAVVGKMMAKRPEDRYQTAAEVAEALAPYARGEAPAGPVSRLTEPPAPAAERTGGETWATLGDDDERPAPRLALTTTAAPEGEDGRPARRHSRTVAAVLDEEERPRAGRRRPSARAKGGGGKIALVIAAAALPVLGLLVAGLYLLLRKSDGRTRDQQAAARALDREKEKGRKEKGRGPVDPPGQEKKPPDKPKGVVPGGKEGPPAAGPGDGKVFKGYTGWVNTVLISPDGKRALAADMTHARLFELPGGKEVRSFRGHAGPISACAVSKDWKRLVTVGWEGKGIVWDLATGQELRKLEGHESGIKCVCVSDDGKRALTCAGKTEASPGKAVLRDANFRLWDLDTGKELQRGQTGHKHPVESVALSEDASLALVADVMTWHVWDVAKWKEAATGQVIVPAFPRVVFLRGNKEGLVLMQRKVERVSVSADGKIEVKGQLSLKFSPGCLAASADGKAAVVVEHSGGLVIGKDEARTRVRVWDLEADRVRAEFETPHTVQSVALSPDRRFILAGNRDGGVVLWGLPKE